MANLGPGGASLVAQTGDILESGIPATQAPRRMRFNRPLVTAFSAFEHQRILAELIAQFIDPDFPRHDADCHESDSQRPSSTQAMPVLYEVAASGRIGWTPRNQSRRLREVWRDGVGESSSAYRSEMNALSGQMGALQPSP
jgi:hypothetical protein